MYCANPINVININKKLTLNKIIYIYIYIYRHTHKKERDVTWVVIEQSQLHHLQPILFNGSKIPHHLVLLPEVVIGVHLKLKNSLQI